MIIRRLKMHQLTDSQAREFYVEHKGRPYFEKLIALMTRNKVVGMELSGTDAIQKWRTLLGTGLIVFILFLTLDSSC